MSEIDLNIGLSDCIWRPKELHEIFDATHDTACGEEFNLAEAKSDENGTRYCPKCDKQVRVQNS